MREERRGLVELRVNGGVGRVIVDSNSNLCILRALDHRPSGTRDTARMRTGAPAHSTCTFVHIVEGTLNAPFTNTCGHITAPIITPARGAPFDVIFMDLYMERVNGDAALVSLRTAGYVLPVLFCTANATSADAERYRALGFAGLLGKPFTAEQMHAVIAGLRRVRDGVYAFLHTLRCRL